MTASAATTASQPAPPATSSTATRPSAWILRALPTLALVALAALVLLLAAENRRLENALRIAGERSSTGLAIGDLLPSFELVPTAPAATGAADATSSASVLDAGSLRRAALFVFTTTCKACEQNHDAWRQLHAELSADHIVLGVGLDSPDAVATYAAHHDLPFEVMAARDAYLAEALGLPGVPMTLVIDAEGRVTAREVGVLADDWRP